MTATVPAHDTTTDTATLTRGLTTGAVLDLRERPLDALREAYDERWHLVADDAPDHPTAEDLARNASEIADLEARCRPAGRVLPRRSGPDPSTFLG
ncbi:hypothetical protein AB1207_15805 [Kineococcus endophyticus]|uniref:Uncharacterized protein n=1 Tax=Kineococcus endophyticus TaxID=1181883 RepID=A0ABV3PAL0_9ACTN